MEALPDNSNLFYFFSTVAQCLAALIGFFSIFIALIQTNKLQKLLRRAFYLIRCLEKSTNDNEVNTYVEKLKESIDIGTYTTTEYIINYLSMSENVNIKKCYQIQKVDCTQTDFN